MDGVSPVRLDRRIAPQPAQAAAYDAKYALYQQVYPTLIRLHRKL
jgi:sugar (pentulose or hexulose) kinase